MILNLTNKPYVTFSAVQRLACHGHEVATQQVKTIEEFDKFFARYSNVVCIIVHKNDVVLANDICNAVSCPVVTLDVELIVDNGTQNWNFVEYNPEDDE